jgi:hypothetical protein
LRQAQEVENELGMALHIALWRRLICSGCVIARARKSPARAARRVSTTFGGRNHACSRFGVARGRLAVARGRLVMEAAFCSPPAEHEIAWDFRESFSSLDGRAPDC